ncbi:hypothetical protein [uncultured Gilvimarinus sp.]|uniref:hypothetical protein n=1 Tax=uncultured Gilvimarinus sp. TaxID=1689143 RepID=UPI0030EEC624|tara:strand:+ start:1941 stop:2534 length:594 start_codon:yes stop_codon:yes gene_type:complete
MKTKITFRVGLSLLLDFALVSIVFGAVVFSGGLITLLEYMGIEYNIETRQIMAAFIVLATALTFGYFRLRQYKEKEVWSLDRGILSRGEPVNLSVDLSTLEKVIPGLPKSKWHNFFYGGNRRPKEQAMVDAMYSCTLTLKLSPNEYLPLYLFNFGGGLELMNEIARNVTEKVDAEHQFTDQERKMLKPRKQNTVVRL